MDDYTFDLEGQVFGLHQAIGIEEKGFQPGSALYGEPATWVFEGFVDQSTDVEALEALAALRRRWTRFREPSDLPALRYALAGRTRRVYGQPQKWDQTIDNRLFGGGGALSMEFKTLDSLHYDDSEQQRLLNISPASLGGYPVPFTTPWSSLHSGVSERSMLVGGDQAAPFTVEFTGPLVGGYLAGGDWRIELVASLGIGDTAVVSTLPWDYSVRVNGSSAAGILAGTTTRLSKARLNPNGETLAFGGTSSSGTATATIRWRAAWSSL
jgi:hypothetical protein